MFYAYESGENKFAFNDADHPKGIRGTVTPKKPPVATAETLDELRLKARAFVGEHPDKTLYLADSENLVHDFVINSRHFEIVERAEKLTAIVVVLLLFAITALITAVTSDLGLWSLVCFVGISLLYVCIVKAGILNEVGGAVLSEILLFLAILLIGIQLKLHARHSPQPSPPSTSSAAAPPPTR